MSKSRSATHIISSEIETFSFDKLQLIGYLRSNHICQMEALREISRLTIITVDELTT